MKALDMSPPPKDSSGKATSSEVAPSVQVVPAPKKKKRAHVSFRHIDLEEFKVRHGTEHFEVRFYNQGDDLTYDMIKSYKYDSQHLLTTVGAFEAGLMLPLYKWGDSFYYDVVDHREGSTSHTHCRSVVQLSENYLRTLRECYLRSKGETTMKCYTPDPEEKSWYTPENFNASFGDYVNNRNRKRWSVGVRTMMTPHGEVLLLSEVSDSKLRFVLGTEKTNKPELYSLKERLRRDHDYEWHATPLEFIVPWAHGWIPGEHGWRPTAQTKPRDGAPSRYGDFCPWVLNFSV
ncbi:uncharacterized protein LOC113292799 [Papaver somniferum]|uniref:uncharacterized protein LOC113292799 n=1 Tax=Papaver somniferum TaxID=3469 RepID=UPI000E702B70|nr:uncharacterized protein LOC113292799 [Papaver somniferum]